MLTRRPASAAKVVGRLLSMHFFGDRLWKNESALYIVIDQNALTGGVASLSKWTT
jgi:hypothetical protein